MSWSFHDYYANRTEGLISKLRLSDIQTTNLKKLRSIVRSRIKEVFEEAKAISHESEKYNLVFESVKNAVSKKLFRYLSEETQSEIALLIFDMDVKARNSFLSLSPRFKTQGSFQYDTLNTPYKTPPQEMDIDDGTYLPMEIFDEQPIIGHRLLILLVDTALISLVSENNGWKFIPKRTCARLQIPNENTHIDVPMYAVPEEQFRLKEAALRSHVPLFESQIHFQDALVANDSAYTLDSDSVNLALRDGEEKWAKSDPKIVEDWFNESCVRIGKHLRSLCRFIKSWRDAQWPQCGGPTSISLMTATVNILDAFPHNKNDLDLTMRLLVDKLPHEFESGIKSPDHTSDSLLFPNYEQHGDAEDEIMQKLIFLKDTINMADSATTKPEALNLLNQAFGNRVTNSDLIVKNQSAAAFISSPAVIQTPKRISETMVSG